MQNKNFSWPPVTLSLIWPKNELISSSSQGLLICAIYCALLVLPFIGAVATFGLVYIHNISQAFSSQVKHVWCAETPTGSTTVYLVSTHNPHCLFTFPHSSHNKQSFFPHLSAVFTTDAFNSGWRRRPSFRRRRRRRPSAALSGQSRVWGRRNHGSVPHPLLWTGAPIPQRKRTHSHGRIVGVGNLVRPGIWSAHLRC